MKKISEIVSVKETDLKVGEVVKKGAEAPIEQQVAVLVVIEDQIAQLKAVSEKLKEGIRSTKYDDLVEKLVDEGKLSSKDSKPVVEITTKLGDVIKVTISSDVDNGFSVSKEMSEKEILESLVPDKYKKTTVSLDKKAIEADFDAGTLPDILKGYVSKTPVEITKLKKSISKGGK